MNSLYIAKNLMRRTIGRRRGILVYLVLPVLVVSLVIGLLGKEASNNPVVVYYNGDSSGIAKHVIFELADRHSYELREASSLQQLKQQIINRKADAGLWISGDFTHQLLAGSVPKISVFQLNVNEVSFTLKQFVNEQVNMLRQSAVKLNAAGQDGSELEQSLDQLLDQQEKHRVHAKIVDNQQYANPALYLSVGFLLMFMMGLINSSVATIVEDRTRHTMARIFAAPVRAYEIAVGNFLGSLFLGTIQITLVLVVTRYVLGFTYGIRFWPQFLILELFLFAAMGIASAVAAMVKNPTHISTVNSLIVTPTCMLGGCYWPLEIMPPFMRKIADFVPQKWAIEAITKMAEGASLASVGYHLLILALIAVLLLGFGSVVLKPAEQEL